MLFDFGAYLIVFLFKFTLIVHCISVKTKYIVNQATVIWFICVAVFYVI